MHATLLFSPGTDPRSPHLALPSLAAFLRGAGVRTTQRDVDLEGFLSLIEPTHLAEAAAACRQRFDLAADPERAGLRALLDESDAIVEHIGAAPAQLRDPVAFYNPFAHHAARQWIRSASSWSARRPAGSSTTASNRHIMTCATR